ncbi:ABC transporter substrate-binding protein [Specibacter cremeus]|uniref:ABC transporter substrate-binding protein n=1 Tax=Specibacter cremeus TaxID=1629051 RepID=UPI000F7975D5|nr:ABC transporter substrate-binding protein [Specibacter cremeus]
MKTRTVPALAMLASVAVAVLTGCGASPATTDSVGGTATLRVASIDIDATIPLTIAQDQGFFKKQGLTVDTTVSPAFDGTLAGVMNGQADIGFGAAPPLLNAMAKKAPVQVVAQTASVVENMTANVDVYGDAITRPRDLAGHTVAVTSLNDLGAVGIRLAVAKDGGDPSKVKLVELPEAQGVDALLQGRIDASVFRGPAQLAARATKGVHVLFQYTDGLPAGSPLDVYFATSTFIPAHADALKRFRAALAEAVTYVNDHPAAARTALAAIYKDVDGGDKLAATLPLTHYSTAINPDAVMALQDGLTKYGHLAGITPAERFYSYSNGK